MKSQTSLVARQTRLSEWAQQIRECQNRPNGMKVEEWCSRQGITKAAYYWRLRKVREAFLESATSVTDAPQSFVEIAQAHTITNESAAEPVVVAVLKGPGKFSLDITDRASASFIHSLLGAMTHAE